MGPETLAAEQKKGVKVTILVVILVMILFIVVLLAGYPITYFGTYTSSVAYCVGVYVPVLVICALAYRRIR